MQFVIVSDRSRRYNGTSIYNMHKDNLTSTLHLKQHINTYITYSRLIKAFDYKKQKQRLPCRANRPATEQSKQKPDTKYR